MQAIIKGIHVPKNLSELDLRLWKSIIKLYLNDPFTHIYLLYDIIYELDHIEVLFELAENNIIGYLFIWRGPRAVCIHIWGKAESLICNVPCDDKAIIVIHNRELLKHVVGFLKPKGEISVKEHLDMVADERSFKPYSAGAAIRLDAGDSHHVEEFLRLTRIAGWKIDREKAKDLLMKRRYYGLFENGRLVSIACAFFRMPEIWPIGNVYTHPDYRGKGYAKAVTSAITRDALQSGAKALLHVAEDNIPAIRVYEALGYKTITKKPWIFFNP